MILSACVFGYGPVGQKIVSKFAELPGYGTDVRVHIVIVKDLTKNDDAVFTSLGQWKLKSYSPENENLSISVGDDIEWLESEGYRGHDVVIDCSWSKENFSAEVESQIQLNPGLSLYRCEDIDKVDDLMDALKDRIFKSRKQKSIQEFGSDYKFTVLDRTDFYSSTEFDPEKLISTDPHRVYENNSFQFRDTKEVGLTEALFAGCSVTYGVGVSIENIWGNVLSKKLGVSATNLSKPGSSTEQIVKNIFKYFSNFGHPEYLFCLFPNYGRYFFPVDGTFYKTKRDEDPASELGTGDKNSSFFQTIHLDADYHKTPPTYIKLPYDYTKVLSPDMYLREACKNIRFLEQYCRAVGIKLFWTTWDNRFQGILEFAQEYQHTKFDYFFKPLESPHYWNAGVDCRKDLFFSNLDDLETCKTQHKDIDCSCGNNCHPELKKEFLDEFYSGTDTKQADGRAHSHFGAHWHAHMAESFYRKVQELDFK